MVFLLWQPRWTKTVVHGNNRVLFGHKKEQSTDMYYKMDDPWKHAKWKISVTKDHMFYDSIYMKYPEQTNS